MDENIRTSIANNFRNTELGFLRIRKNLQIAGYSDIETESYLRKVILSTHLECIEKRGKNHYFTCAEFNAILTINSYSLTVITAKKLHM
jgi:hypothetical protein